MLFPSAQQRSAQQGWVQEVRTTLSVLGASRSLNPTE